MSVSRRALFGKLDSTLFRSLESATAFARLRGNPHVEIVHWLHQLWQLNDSDLHRIVRHYRIDAARLQQDLTAALMALPGGASSLTDFSHHVGTAAERAWIHANLEMKAASVRGASLLAAMAQTPELRRMLLDMSAQFASIPADWSATVIAEIVTGSPESVEPAQDGSGREHGIDTATASSIDSAGKPGTALARYCTDLTAHARGGSIDPVIGRSHEIRTMVDILMRRRQNNPLLTGDAGVGKTAVVEGLALAIVAGDVPPPLLDVKLLSLDVSVLLAGAGQRGEFESRLKDLLDEAEGSAQPVVLFIDEVHTLVGAGGQAGTGDAANLLKPALARGSLRTIGATTWSEYKKHIEKDPALTRRFQVLQINEPDEASAIDMLRGLVPVFSTHHGVTILDEAVRAAVVLSHRYLPARQLPDKAISLLDTACARVAMSLQYPPATVENLRQRLAALESERCVLQAEGVVVRKQELRHERHTKAGIELLSLRLELNVAEKRWHAERLLVTQLHDRRESHGNHESEPPSGRLTGDDRAQAQESSSGLGSETTKNVPGAHVVTHSPELEMPSPELVQLESDLQKLQGEDPLVFAQVDEAVIASIVADWTGIPTGRMVSDDVSAVLGLQATLTQRIAGQDEAMATIVERIQASRAQLTDPGKPVGVFLLAGPSGVGKTETALALAEQLYGGEQNLITINMSEFQEAHTVSTLRGSPPGYIGYGEGGVLTEAVRRRPYSVVLLDEIEKAHPDVHEVFYQVFDKGWMDDAEGRRVDFRNTTILLTSNTGAGIITSLCDDGRFAQHFHALREALQPALREVFHAAFLGRLTVVPYLPLSNETLTQIVSLQLARIAGRMRLQHGVELVCHRSLAAHVIARCGTHETGARRLIGFLEQNLLPPLSRLWLAALQEKRVLTRIELRASGDGTFIECTPFFRD
ncbi:MAG: type VI secretion system ATPase TssH [Comamonadaceae bacterium]|nr:MAG: type VI secretion system ATPase TssH [Comamonadaceae bacterium]